MPSNDEVRGKSTTRRTVLAALGATGVSATTGCVGRLRNVVSQGSPKQVSLNIMSVPADDDPVSVDIARHLVRHLQACGVDAQVVPVSLEELHRQVLLNNTFDLYVGQFHQSPNLVPDDLYSLLHSSYAVEPGWQNPFGYTNLNVDEHLETQRRTAGAKRRKAIHNLQRVVADTVPFSVVAFPDQLAAVRADSFDGWGTYGLDSPLDVLALDSCDGSHLRLVTTDERITENRNPIAAAFRRRGTFIGLLYDALGRSTPSGVTPWLATDWKWVDGSPRTDLRVELREGLQWHDGQPLTADDVQFTFRFLADTSLGRAESPIPAPLYRGYVSLVNGIEVHGDRTLTFNFGRAAPTVALRALTVPVLPEHVWTNWTGKATVAGLEVDEELTEALVKNNLKPVGSGPFEFRRAKPDESLSLTAFEEHFLYDTSTDQPEGFADKPCFDELTLLIASSDASSVQLVASDQAHATVSGMNPDTVPQIGRDENLRLVSRPSSAFYHVGFNARRPPLGNPRFRRVVARLIDKASIVDDSLNGYALPAASPLARTRWLAPDLRWRNGKGDPATPFFDDGNGQLDVKRAKAAFREAGYRYADGALISR